MKTEIMRRFIPLFLLLAGSIATAVENPLSVSIESSVVRYNGAYYSMGTATNGQLFSSTDLFEWTTPSSVISTNLAGPYELVYRNGFFHLFVPKAGYSFSPAPHGPYAAFKRVGVTREQMQLFQEASGELVSVSRNQGSKKQGEIWMQRLKSPWKVGGRPRQLLDGRRGMWDSLDSADLGAPAMLGYRENYYLLYAANNPSPRTGLREVGVAMNEKAVHFDNTDKLPDPVLSRNAERLARSYIALMPTGEYAEWRGRYTLESPEKGWTGLEFKTAGWRSGEGAFGFPDEVEDSRIYTCRTKWKSNEIWVRREFELLGDMPKTPVLNIRHEGAVRVYLNGKKVFESSQPSISYSNFDLSKTATDAFLPEKNIVAVHAVVKPESEYRYLDFGLYDAGDYPVEETVYSPTDVRFVEGPNGFERWAAYKAYWNGVAGTGLDRVFFYEDEMVIDGPTTTNTPGYHPPPAKPTFSDSFSAEDEFNYTDRWAVEAGSWTVADGVLQQTDERATAKAYLRKKPAANYLFETNIRFPKNSKGGAGVVAYNAGGHELTIIINPAARLWAYRILPGSLAPSRFKLPKAFEFRDQPPGSKDLSASLHRLRVTKNGGYFEVMLDDFKLTEGEPIRTDLLDAGVPGLCTQNSAAEFDGVVYTVGWDEYNEYITGWGSADDRTLPSGEWIHHREDGLEQKKHSEPGRAFKGDLLDQYEFTVNARTETLQEGKERLYGVFPVYVDAENYLKAMIDTRNRTLVVSGMRGGEELGPFAATLNRQIPLRHLYDKQTSYRDIAAWVYSLRSESVITGLDIRWLEGDYKYLQQEFFVPVDDMVIRYANLDEDREPILWDDGRFDDADEPKPRPQLPGVLNPVLIRPVEGNNIAFGFYTTSSYVMDRKTGRYLRPYDPGEELDNDEMLGGDLEESDTLSRPQETLVSVEVESSYFFRCVKLADQVIVELNGQPMVTVDGAWPDSQVGLLTEGQPCFFNGITLMHLPEEQVK